jgi:hypothetical protein
MNLVSQPNRFGCAPKQDWTETALPANAMGQTAPAVTPMQRKRLCFQQHEMTMNNDAGRGLIYTMIDWPVKLSVKVSVNGNNELRKIIESRLE